MIEVQHLTKRYGKIVAVDDLSFSIEPGQILGLLGPNGAGKSTTMNILTGYLSSTEGRVLIDGIDILEHPIEAKRKIGYLPELPPLYMEMSVTEYLTFICDLKGVKKHIPEHIEEVCKLVKIDHVAKRLIKNLSKGYKQRVGIAQALLGDPEVVILDEPTVGLDPKQIMEIRALIQSLGKDHTVILSSHILSEVQAVCQTILILSKGRLVACDTPENLEKRFAGTTTVELTAEATAEEVRAILAPLDHILEVTTREEPRGRCGVVLETDGEDALCREIFFAFSRAQKALLRMTTAQTSLEEIFLELTAEAPVVQLPGEGQRQDGEEAEG